MHIFSDKTTEKAQSFYPMVMQNCQLPLDERRKPENCLVTALLPVLKKRECVGALSRADAATACPTRPLPRRLSANEAANRRMRAALQTRCWLEALRTLGLAPEEGEASWDMARAAFRAARPAPRAVPRRLPRRSPHLAGCRSAFLLTLPPRASSRPKASLAGVSMRDARGHPHTVYVRLELLQLDHPEAAAACGCFQTRCPHCRRATARAKHRCRVL